MGTQNSPACQTPKPLSADRVPKGRDIDLCMGVETQECRNQPPGAGLKLRGWTASYMYIIHTGPGQCLAAGLHAQLWVAACY